MRLEELQGFIQGLWENLASDHGPGERGHALHKCNEFAELSPQSFPCPSPPPLFLEQVLVLGACKEKDPSTGPGHTLIL